MKSKYYQSLFLIGVLPVLCLAGVYFWALLTQAPVSSVQVSSVDTTAVKATIPLLQTQIKTIGSTIGNAVQKTYGDAPGLSAHHTDADLENFVKSHPGVAGVVILSKTGQLQSTVPATPPLVDPAYGSSEEFQKTLDKLDGNSGKAYLFYTQKFSYPSLVFAVSLPGNLVAETVLRLSDFFRAMDLKSGEIFLMDAGSGNYLYHSNPSKMGTSFNPDQEPWLTTIQTNLMNKQDGAEFNPDKISAVYAYAGFGNCGIVHMIPSAALQPASSPAPARAAKSFPENIPDLLQTPSGIVGLIASLVALAWVFLVGAIYFGVILGPVKKAGEVVLGAAQGSGKLTPDVAQRFGHDEIGKMVQAVSGLLDKVEKDKQQNAQEREEVLRKGKAQVEEKTKEAANQVAEAQKQAQAVRSELNDKNQSLNDKLRELDALKGMSEGLRTQNEQAKGENAKLRSQISLAEEASTDLKKRVVETQGRLIEMESKMLQTVAASSAIQVSAVRAAAIRTMADELKTTLGIIKGYVSSALGTTQGGINEKQQEFLGMVINRSARLEKFINDLLDIYQVETEQAEAKHEEVNLASEIEGLAFNFQAQADVKTIKIKVEAKPGVPKVPIVRRRFNQLWNILYLQIIKDAPRNSNVTIEVEPIGDNVKVTVTDPGLTVAPEGLPKLFDEFYDPKHPASPQLAGTGLKFALIKTILAAHGGGAVAEKADPGTKLTLTFSTKIKRPSAPPVLNIPSAAAKPATPAIGTPLPPPPPKPAGAGLDSLLAGKVPSVTAPGVKPPMPGMPAAPAPLGAPPAARPPMPGMPAAPAAPPAAKPPAPAMSGGLLDSLLDKKIPAPGAMPPPSPAMPPRPAAPAPSATSGALDALMGAKPPAAPSAPGMVPPPALKPPSLGSIPPSPSMAPPMAPKPPVPAAPGAPVVPTSLKPTVPPPGILNLDNMDSFKVDASPAPPKPMAPPVPGAAPPMGSPKPPMAPPMGAPPMGAPKPPSAPVMPPPGAPKPPPLPGMPPGGLNANKPIVKDLAKEGEGDLIE